MPHKTPIMKFRTYTKKAINKKGELKVYTYSKMYDINKKFACEICGGKYTKNNKWRHNNKVKKHIKALEKLKEINNSAEK